MKSYIIELVKGIYVRTSKYDTIDINEAKRFDSIRQLKAFAWNMGIDGYNIKEVDLWSYTLATSPSMERMVFIEYTRIR